MSGLLEHTVQNAAIEWLQSLGYTYLKGNSLTRDLKKVVLEDDLRQFLTSTYDDVPTSVINDAMAAFTQHDGMDTDHRNRDFHRKMTQGVSFSWKDATGKEYARHIYPINFTEPEQNTFVCTDEVTIIGKNNRRTDLLIYINGLPIIVFEFKNMFDASV